MWEAALMKYEFFFKIGFYFREQLRLHEFNLSVNICQHVVTKTPNNAQIKTTHSRQVLLTDLFYNLQ